ncbi:MAG: molecular chaperone HtpG [Spirochaetaceae bacterium]|nr:molecular chaperone HtpG [Spirochaetaceae bacterium]
MSSHQFQTEVSQLLHLIVHSLYSHKEIFLRELISNASDALDKLKYLSLTDDNYKKLAYEPRIDISFDDGDVKKLVVRDTGIGMDAEELALNLGTIAKSGTKNFITSLTGDAKKDSNLIGQFGVGFYSAFMVADKIEVISKKAGSDKASKWSSDGKGTFDIDEAEKTDFGTEVILYLNENGKEYSSRWQIENIIKKYSDHIAFPIFLEYFETKYEGTDDKEGKKEKKIEKINSASALWKRSKSELSDNDYNEFYKIISHDSDEPLFYMHTNAEGTINYTTLFFIPKLAPFDMFQADYRPGVKLYVSRVFITDDNKELMPTYLRFLRGVIDSEDLPLNVSREILQQNKIMTNIKSASVKKVLSEFKKLSESNPEKYTEFIKQYNRPLKEGLYSDFGNKELLQDLVRFKSTTREGFVSFADYVSAMKEDQKSIYYISGDNEETLRDSPLLEAYKEKGIEVLIMNDDIDEIVIPTLIKYKDKDLKAINRSGTADELKTSEDKEKEKEAKPVVEKIKKALGDTVKDVIASSRLSGSPSCIVMDENDPSIQMQHMFKAMGQKQMPEFKPILEVNPEHDIVKKIADTNDDLFAEDLSFLLLEQAKIMEGEEIKKPADFVKRLNRILNRSN